MGYGDILKTFMERFKLFENVEEICSVFSSEDKVEKEYLGNL